jgi:hypothetical protein
MQRWKLLAEDAGVPPEEAARVESSLEMLERTFRPLANSIAIETEPAFMVTIEELPK